MFVWLFPFVAETVKEIELKRHTVLKCVYENVHRPCSQIVAQITTTLASFFLVEYVLFL